MLKQSFAVEPIEGHYSEIRARDEREMSVAAVSTLVPGPEEHHGPIHVKSMDTVYTVRTTKRDSVSGSAWILLPTSPFS
jgi:hypothetical protein